MNTNGWYRSAMAAVALGGGLALYAALGAHATAFAADNDPAANPAVVEPQAPPPPQGEFREPAGPPPPDFREQGWPPPQGNFEPRRGEGREDYGRGPQDNWADREPRGEFQAQYMQGPGPRGRHADGPMGSPPGPRFRGQGPGQDCPDRPYDGRGAMRQPGGPEGFEPPRPPDPDAIFDRIDKDGDGNVTREEFRAFRPPHHPPQPPMRGRQDDARPTAPPRPFPLDERPQE